MGPTRAGLLLFLTVLAVACSAEKQTILLRVGGVELKVEVARTPEDQRQGLMNRRSIGERSGMLFVYRADRRMSFWMKNTIVPLSIAFIAADGEITQIEDMEPLSLEPVNSTRSVRYALEVQRGLFQSLGVGPGDRVEFPEGFR